MSTLSICAIAVVAVSIAFTVFGFIHIFQQKQDQENDLNIIQRQLRGFALIMAASLVAIYGMMLCSGNLFPYLGKLVQE